MGRTTGESGGILVASKNKKMPEIMKGILPFELCRNMRQVTTAAQLEQVMITQEFALIIIDTPMEDDFGVETAIRLSEQYSVGIMLLVKPDLYEQVSDRVEEFGIATLPKQTGRQFFYMTVKLLLALRNRILRMKKENHRLNSKVDEMKLIDRAKWLLIEKNNMTEPEAHRYIEREAMNRCMKRSAMAEKILKEFLP